ncbi:unnamed protein product [uncultured bacterium]|nr:unnamed protein product [uncultured bacterium]
MKSTRRRHDPEFKAKIALEALRGIRTIQEIAREHDLHPVQVSDWKKQLQGSAGLIFSGPKVVGTEDQSERERVQLHSKIGELAVHVDFLKKKCKQLGLSTE